MKNNIKDFFCSIYIDKNGKAVKGFNDASIISEEPVVLAASYADAGADGIIVFDFSETDAEHEQNLDIIQEICMDADVPVIGAGNVKRMEDIKKLLYAGCSKAALNLSKQCGYDIMEEVALKFGRDKIVSCYQEGLALDASMINKYSGTIIILPAGAGSTKCSENMLHYVIHTDDEISSSLDAVTDSEKIRYIAEGSASEMISVLKNDDICGITGTAVNDHAADIISIKKECSDNGITIRRLVPAFQWSDLKKDNDGHVTVVVQDYRTDQVLMVAYMDEEAYNRTIETGRMTYFSRSRQELWIKGETSGHYQYVRSLTADCDLDTILAKVKQVGAACHTGSYSCFFNEIASKKYKEKNPQKVLDNLYDVVCDRRVNPREGSYTNYLFDKGIDKILKKCGEECTEIVIAAKNPNPNEIKYEISDFLYHMIVLMVERGVTWEQITDELSRR